jgi:GntR family transcriptional regulator/MocR family aminotransferase
VDIGTDTFAEYAITQLIRKYFPTQIEMQGESGGLHIELTIHTSYSADQLIELALLEGVRVYGANNAGVHGQAEYPKIYLGFGGIRLKDMEDGVQRLRKAWLST